MFSGINFMKQIFSFQKLDKILLLDRRDIYTNLNIDKQNIQILYSDCIMMFLVIFVKKYYFINTQIMGVEWGAKKRI